MVILPAPVNRLARRLGRDLRDDIESGCVRVHHRPLAVLHNTAELVSVYAIGRGNRQRRCLVATLCRCLPCVLIVFPILPLIRKRLVPGCRNYMLASHVSAEPVGKMLLDTLGLKPLITAEMRLGEGTGGLMLLPLLDCALSVYNSAHKFDEINIERYRPL